MAKHVNTSNLTPVLTEPPYYLLAGTEGGLVEMNRTHCMINLQPAARWDDASPTGSGIASDNDGIACNKD